MKVINRLTFVFALSFFCLGIISAQEKHNSIADSLLQKLMDGNERFVEEKLTHPHQTAERRSELTKDQKPFAIILSCADSRVPPEIVFDQGLGDLFVIRVAGNIISDEVLGSIEYAVEHLHVKLLIVLGHEKCGAVDAALSKKEYPEHISSLVKAIRPAIKGIDELDKAVRANVNFVVKQLKSSKPVLEEAFREGHLEIIGARYDLDNGSVGIIE